MRKYIKYALSGAVILFFMFSGAMIYRFFDKQSKKQTEMQYGSELIQQQLKNVSKLVVNEARFSQILNYKDQQSYFMNLVKFEKKALIVVNAEVQISYDLSKLTYVIDEVAKTVRITHIPQEEIKISPDIKIYDVEESRFNTFKGEDYNTINQKVKEDLNLKIRNSNIEKNAKNRLLSELSKFLVVTQSLGWTLQYQDIPIQKEADLEQLRL